MHAPTSVAPTAPPVSTRRILMASFVGTAIEFYDFYIYATAAALVIGPLFFPPGDPTAQTLQAFATFAVAFLARPVGAVVFGHFGDRVGRKATLVASLLVMGVSTVGIGLLPSYASAGWWAPAALCCLRFGQGLGLGGEWGGAALLAVENAPPHRRALYGVAPQLGAPIGFLAANLLFLALSATLEPGDFEAWGWRLPFLASAILVALGLFMRLKLTETPAFAQAMREAAPERVPLAVVFSREHLRATLSGTLAMVAPYAVFYLCTVFALSWGVTHLGYTRTSFLLFECVAVLFLAAAIPLSAAAADRFGHRPVLLSGLTVTAGLGLLLGPMLGSGEPALVLGFLCLGLFVMGWIFGPMGAYLPALFPVRVRYTGASVTYNLAGILGAAAAPVLAQGLAAWGGIGWVGVYLAVTAGVSFAAVVGVRQ